MLFATVTPSFVIRGNPISLSITTFLPLKRNTFIQYKITSCFLNFGTQC